MFDGSDGLFRTYLRGGYDPARLRDGLGARWEFTNLSYKPYPCCRFTHTAIDAALAVAAQPGFHPASVRRVAAGVNRQSFEAVCTPQAMRQHPVTVVQAQFSIPYTVAVALIDREVGLRHFTPEALQRPDVLALAARVECAVDEAIERGWARSISPTALLVEAANVAHQQRVDVPGGHPQAPMSTEMRRAKLLDCLRAGGPGWSADMADRLTEMVAGVATLPQARVVAQAMQVRA